MSVKVSGRFLVAEQDFLREDGLTEEGSRTEPEFIVKFTHVEPVPRR
jgi:hypothetical protein